MEQKALLEETMAALRKNGFQPLYFARREEAVDWILSQVASEGDVGFGGSMTVKELDLPKKLAEKGLTLWDHSNFDAAKYTKREVLQKEIFADYFFCSANGITAQGEIFNVDGAGNRVAALCCGPKKVFLVAGINKLCSDLVAAQRRLEEVAAPKNCVRLHMKTPCAVTGQCQDCSSPQRICRSYLVQRKANLGVDISVILIGEVLGY